MIIELSNGGWIETKCIISIYREKACNFFEKDKEILKCKWTILLKTGKTFTSKDYFPFDIIPDEILSLKKSWENDS